MTSSPFSDVFSILTWIIAASSWSSVYFFWAHKLMCDLTWTVAILLDVSVDLCFITSLNKMWVHYGFEWVWYTMVKIIWTPDHHTIVWCHCWTTHPRFYFYFKLFIISSTLLWRLSTRFWCIAVGMCSFSYISKSISEVRRWLLVRRPGVQFIPNLFSGVEVSVLKISQVLLLQP